MEISCLHCAKTFSVEKVSSVKKGDAYSDSVHSGEFFKWTCPECGRESVLSFPFLYHDEENGLIVLLSTAPIKGEGLPEGYKGRIVASAGELIEKIKIFEAGLDDMVIELCKYITLNELGKDVGLKFFRVDGSDSELSFTYPEGGQMQMLTIGLNVYEDCVGIIQRNPAMLQQTGELLRIDQEWIAKFFA